MKGRDRKMQLSMRPNWRPLLALFLALTLVFSGLSVGQAAANGTPSAKNVILLIGDGMGFHHVNAARDAVTSDPALGEFNLDKVNDASGMVYTKSADADITDSSAAATALATGYKTLNRMLGMTPDDDELTPDVVPTLVELSKDKGLAAGLVTTTQIAHATPAGFASHIAYRNQFNKIAAQYYDLFAAKGKPIEVIMGGQQINFTPEGRPAYYKDGGGQKVNDDNDSRNLISEFKNSGYQYATTAADLNSVSGGKLLGLFTETNGLTPENQRKADNTEPHLKDMTAKALELLSANDKGFFLMVEGGQIDWAAHANDFDYTVAETIAFDQAVKAALDFQANHPDTLIIVTADHETGGLVYNTQTKEYTWNSTDHTSSAVPIMAEGPGADLFKNTMDNTEIPRKIAQLMNLNKPLVIQSDNGYDPASFAVTSMGVPVPQPRLR